MHPKLQFFFLTGVYLPDERLLITAMRSSGNPIASMMIPGRWYPSPARNDPAITSAAVKKNGKFRSVVRFSSRTGGRSGASGTTVGPVADGWCVGGCRIATPQTGQYWALGFGSVV